MTTQRFRGVGTLHFPDGRVWGEVRYDISCVLPSVRSLGTIHGQLVPMDEARGPAGFHDILGEAAVHLQDGSWWRCSVIDNEGTASDHSGLAPAGPQPKS